MVTFKINGIDFSSLVVKLERSADKLDKYAQRTLDGNLKREMIGTFVNYKLSFGNNVKDKNLYNNLFLEMIRPSNFVSITLPNKNAAGTYTFSGYIASVKDSIIYLSDSEQIVEGLECDIITQGPTWKAGEPTPNNSF